MNSASYSYPPRILLLLSAVVLLIHWVCLLDIAGSMTSPVRTWATPFQTRAIRTPDTATSQIAPRRSAKRKPAVIPSSPPEAPPNETAVSAPIETPVPVELVAAEPAVPETEQAIEPPPATPSPPSIALPPPRRLLYDIFGQIRSFSYSVNGELLWQHDESSYSARAVISAFLLGSRVQTSVGTLTAQGLAPTRFGDKVRSEVAAHFEREKGTSSSARIHHRKNCCPVRRII